jgi:hypothetical protein
VERGRTQGAGHRIGPRWTEGGFGARLGTKKMSGAPKKVWGDAIGYALGHSICPSIFARSMTIASISVTVLNNIGDNGLPRLKTLLCESLPMLSLTFIAMFSRKNSYKLERVSPQKIKYALILHTDGCVKYTHRPHVCSSMGHFVKNCCDLEILLSQHNGQFVARAPADH